MYTIHDNVCKWQVSDSGFVSFLSFFYFAFSHMHVPLAAVPNTRSGHAWEQGPISAMGP